MKRSLFLGCLLFLVVHLSAETVKMKDGALISGSILSQTEYILNLATSYGNITLNQREIEQILPDKHRIVLKGGSQLVGIITDMDEFNLTLQTDEGTIVHIDMPQIVSVEAYDYERGENAQKEYVEKTQAAAAVAAATAAQQQATATASTVAAEGGLTFDSDINQVFGAQKATVVNGEVVTPSAQVTKQAPRPLTDEEAFLKGVKTGEVTQQEYASAAKEELLKKNQHKKAKKEPVKRPSEKEFSKYFSIQAGVRPMDLKLDNSSRGANWTADDKDIDVGGTGAAVSAKFLWRIKDSNFWVGPKLGISNVPSAKFADKDQAVADANATAIGAGDPPPYPDPQVRTSGQVLNIGAAANYYLTPKSKFAFYLTASAEYELLKLNYRGELNSTTINSSGIAASAGIGVETWVDDLMLGLEVREVMAKRSGDLSASSSASTVAQVQLSWKF